MNKLKLQILPKVSLITFIAGLVIIIFSPKLGIETVGALLGPGVTSPDTFSAILQASINSYYIIGAVLFFIGGLGCLISIIIFEQQKQ